MDDIVISEDTRLAVKRGAYLLEQYGITDLSSQINLDTLDLWNPEFCVLGQIFGGYGEGRDSLDLETETATVEHGFCAPSDVTARVVAEGHNSLGNREHEYRELTQAWKEYLSQ